MPFYNILSVLYSGAQNAFKYYTWKYNFKQEISFKSLNSATAFAMFPIDIYKNMAVHGQKKILDDPGMALML